MAIISCSKCGGTFNIPDRTNGFSSCAGHRSVVEKIEVGKLYRITDYDHRHCGEFGTATDVAGDQAILCLKPGLLYTWVHRSQVIECSPMDEPTRNDTQYKTKSERTGYDREW